MNFSERKVEQLQKLNDKQSKQIESLKDEILRLRHLLDMRDEELVSIKAETKSMIEELRQKTKIANDEYRKAHALVEECRQVQLDIKKMGVDYKKKLKTEYGKQKKLLSFL